MAIKIDTTLLQELGLAALPDAEKNSLLKHIYETLEMRVGMRLADQMTNEQLDEFEQYFDAKDDAGAFKWLETNFPNYKDIVQEEFDKLKAEIAQSAPQILAAAQPAPAPAPMPQQPPVSQPTPAAPAPVAPQPPQPPQPPAAAPTPPAPQAPQPLPPQPQQPDFPTQQPPAGPGFQQ
jgi:hypothetical protein